MSTSPFGVAVRYEPLDQVNLEFRTTKTDQLDELLEHVLRVLDGSDWGTGRQFHQYLEEPTGGAGVLASELRVERAHRVKSSGTPSSKALGSLGLAERFHVRFWFGRSVIGRSVIHGLAHRERPRLFPIDHEVMSFEDGKHEVEACFNVAGWAVQPDAVAVSTPITHPASNGMLTIISEV
jgi:hypothetical protein